MPYSISGTTVQIYDKTLAGLALTATFEGGTIPTTASTFALGCRMVDNTTGDIYFNEGTVAVPVWVPATRTVKKSLTAAELIAMYAAPVAVVPAVPGKMIVVDAVDFVITRTASAFTGGGVVAVQYAATANGAGTATHATIAATVVTGAAGTTYTARIPVVLSDVASASAVNVGLYISNATAAFAAGTGTADVYVRYHLV